MIKRALPLVLFSLVISLALAWALAPKGLGLSIEIEAPTESRLQIFWLRAKASGFTEADSSVAVLRSGKNKYDFVVPTGTRVLRIDTGIMPLDLKIYRINTASVFNIKHWGADRDFVGWKPQNQITNLATTDGVLSFKTTGDDPFFVYENWREVEFLALAKIFGLVFLVTFAVVGIMPAACRALLGSSKSLVGPGIFVLSFLLFGSFGLYAYSKIAKPVANSVVYQGEAKLYDLALLSSKGEKISSRTGALKLMNDPFTIYRLAPDQVTVGFTINSQRFRGKFDDKRENKLFVVGGSAAFGHGLPRDEACLSAQLESLDTSRHVVNAAVPGYLSGQELALMVHYLDDYKPNAYLIFDGWNEVLEQMVSEPRRPGFFGFNSAFFVSEERLRKYYLTETKDQDSPAHNIAPVMDDKYRSAIARNYADNLLKMAAFAKARQAKFYVVFQPELGAKKLRTTDEQKILDDWDNQFGYVKRNLSGEYKNLIASVSKELDLAKVPYLNLSSSAEFIETSEPLYYDAVHLNEAGTKLVAKMVNDFLKLN